MLCMSSGILGTKLALILNMGFGIVSELAFRRIAVNDKCYSRHGKHIRLHDSYLDCHGMQKKLFLVLSSISHLFCPDFKNITWFLDWNGTGLQLNWFVWIVPGLWSCHGIQPRLQNWIELKLNLGIGTWLAWSPAFAAISLSSTNFDAIWSITLKSLCN